MKKDRKENRIQRNSDRFQANPVNAVRNVFYFPGLNAEIINSAHDETKSIVLKSDGRKGQEHIWGYYDLQSAATGMPQLTIINHTPFMNKHTRKNLENRLTYLFLNSDDVIGSAKNGLILLEMMQDFHNVPETIHKAVAAANALRLART